MLQTLRRDASNTPSGCFKHSTGILQTLRQNTSNAPPDTRNGMECSVFKFIFMQFLKVYIYAYRIYYYAICERRRVNF